MSQLSKMIRTAAALGCFLISGGAAIGAYHLFTGSPKETYSDHKVVTESFGPASQQVEGAEGGAEGGRERGEQRAPGEQQRLEGGRKVMSIQHVTHKEGLRDPAGIGLGFVLVGLMVSGVAVGVDVFTNKSN